MTSNPLQPNDPKSLAADWFNLQRAGELTAGETRAFEVWRGRSRENEEAFRELERKWGVIGDISEDPAIMEIQARVEKAVEARRRSGVFGAVAVGLVLAVAGGVALERYGVLAQFGWFAPTPMQEFRTSVGQRTAVTLLDGSVVTLDTDTILRVRLSARERRIELERGQAFFKVAKDRSRPFIVAAGDKTVRATGTAFDVRVDPERFEVTLIEGRVRVQERSGKNDDPQVAEMRPGWRLAVGEDTRWRIEPVDIAKETSWHEGFLTFHEDPLERAAAEMNRYSHRKIVFKGKPPATVVLGVFRAGDMESFVRAIELNRLARVISENEDEVELAAR